MLVRPMAPRWPGALMGPSFRISPALALWGSQTMPLVRARLVPTALQHGQHVRALISRQCTAMAAAVAAAAAGPPGEEDDAKDSGAGALFPAARLLDKQKEMFELQAELDEQKLLHERQAGPRPGPGRRLPRQRGPSRRARALQEDAFKAREAVLKKKDLELQESLVRFSRFLQENDAKCARASRKAADERHLCEEKALECRALVRPGARPPARRAPAARLPA